MPLEKRMFPSDMTALPAGAEPVGVWGSVQISGRAALVDVRGKCVGYCQRKAAGQEKALYAGRDPHVKRREVLQRGRKK